MQGNPSDAALKDLLKKARTIAVVGCSPRPERTSHQIAAQMQKHGYRIVPIHPEGGTILGEKVYPDLLSIPADTHVDIVDVFRRPETVVAVAQAAVQIKAGTFWLQLGIVNEEAAQIARDGGLVAVQDLCIAVMYRMLGVAAVR